MAFFGESVHRHLTNDINGQPLSPAIIFNSCKDDKMFSVESKIPTGVLVLGYYV